MPARRITTVTVPVQVRSGVAFEAYRDRTPLLTIWAARPALLVTLTLPEQIEPGTRWQPCGNTSCMLTPSREPLRRAIAPPPLSGSRRRGYDYFARPSGPIRPLASDVLVRLSRAS